MGYVVFWCGQLVMVGHWAHQTTQMYYNGVHHPQIAADDGPIELGIERYSRNHSP